MLDNDSESMQVNIDDKETTRTLEDKNESEMFRAWWNNDVPFDEASAEHGSVLRSVGNLHDNTYEQQQKHSILQVMEQHNHSNNLEIQCVLEHRQESLISTVSLLAKVVAMDLKQDAIHYCTSVAKSSKDNKRPRSITVM
ncbi:unnamed protein product [Leptidea sinapis]|uniref:Uncharacterized protein n=1 Tax=Leptidea sinapis TaxID=189913 RepID=A0A5E4QFE4_9NEOP|nr:unnamed protein product [Leptidea sinapis]